VRVILLALALAGPLAASFLVTGAAGDQTFPAAASADSGFLIAWQDGRDLPADSVLHIYACRLNAAGQVIDSAGLQVSDDTLEDYLPALASDGFGYFAVWHRGC
jgi:hypothetical protein